jgi:hypothetical protein
MPQHLPPVVFALSLTLVAGALGGLCGRATAGRAWHSRAAVVALAALLWALMTRPPLLYVGGGDLLWLWGAFALSVAAGRRATTLRWKPLLASVVFGALLLELGARVAVPPRRCPPRTTCMQPLVAFVSTKGIHAVSWSTSQDSSSR